MTAKNRIELYPSDLFMQRLEKYMSDTGITRPSAAMVSLATIGLKALGYIVDSEPIVSVEPHGGKRPGAGRKAKDKKLANAEEVQS